ncbi:MAG: metalloregulator ArsR/SmtB family transcription factor [Candidatus Omnitrophota bacterium]
MNARSHSELTELLNPEFREMLADRIRALGEATRIQLIHHLMIKERSVKELVEIVGKSQATVSKHLSILYRHGFLQQRREGAQTFYSLRTPGMENFCQFMCESLRRHLQDMHDAATPHP